MPSNHIFMYFDWIFNGFVCKQRPIETVVQPYDFCFFTDLSKLLCKTIFLTIYLASFSFVLQWNTCCGSNSMDDLAQHPYKTVDCFRGIECISTDGILLFWIVNFTNALIVHFHFLFAFRLRDEHECCNWPELESLKCTHWRSFAINDEWMILWYELFTLTP